jgi:outer membrane protein TolC
LHWAVISSSELQRTCLHAFCYHAHVNMHPSLLILPLSLMSAMLVAEDGAPLPQPVVPAPAPATPAPTTPAAPEVLAVPAGPANPSPAAAATPPASTPAVNAPAEVVNAQGQLPPIPQPAPGAPAYTLAEALADASRLNDTAEIAAARLAFSMAQRKQAYALIIPSLTANGAYNSTSISGQPWGASPVNYLGVGAGISMTLFNPSAYPALKGAKIAVEQQTYLSEDLRRQLSYQVVSGFLGIITAERNLAAAKQILSVSKESYDESAESAKVGLKSFNDATRAELDVANAQLAYTNAQQAVVAARLSVGDLVGHEITIPFIDPAPAELPPGDLPMMESLALRTRPDLQANVLQIRIEDEAIRVARYLELPSFGLSATYANRNYHPEQTPIMYPAWSIALTASWTIYDGGLSRGEMEANQALRRQASAVEHGGRVDLRRDLATAISNLSTQNAAVTQAGVSVHVAQVNFDEVKTKYAHGLSTQLDVSDANSALFSADVGLIAARLNYASARFQLRLLVGWWPLTNVDPAPDRERLRSSSCGK